MENRFGIQLFSRDVGARNLETMAGVWSRATLARNASSLETDIPSVVNLLRTRAEQADAWFAFGAIGPRTVAIAHGLAGRENDGESDEVIPGLMHVSMIAVEPEVWGQGYGRAIVEFAIERARQQGYARVQLWTQVTNARAIALYEILGFRAAGREMPFGGELVRLYGLDLVCDNTRLAGP
jgi:ribosomal protein S18 acetylase RimI-like enzyme